MLLLALAHAASIATVRLGAGLPDGFGLSASLTALRPLELELGVGTLILYTTVTARAGVGLPIHDGRDATGRGVLVEGLALGGYRYLHQDLGGAAFDRDGLEGDVAGELKWWAGPRVALDVQALFGAGVWVTTQPEGTPLFLDGRLSVGVGF